MQDVEVSMKSEEANKNGNQKVCIVQKAEGNDVIFRGVLFINHMCVPTVAT